MRGHELRVVRSQARQFLGAAHRAFDRLVVELIDGGDALLLAEGDRDRQFGIFDQARRGNGVARVADVAVTAAAQVHFALVGAGQRQHLVANALGVVLVQVFHWSGSPA